VHGIVRALFLGVVCVNPRAADDWEFYLRRFWRS